MAREVDVEAARPLETVPRSETCNNHEISIDTTDRDPATDVSTRHDSEIRRRPQQLQSSTADDQNETHAKTSAIEQNAASTNVAETIQEKSRPVSWSTATLQQIRRSFTFSTTSRSSKEIFEALNHLRGYDKIKRREELEEEIDKFPRGFPRTAAFQSSDNDFVIFRGFLRLHCRLLEQLEVELELLGNELDELDKADDANDELRYRLGRTKLKEGGSTAQLELFEKIRLKLEIYGNILLQNSRIQNLDRPPTRNHRSVFSYIHGNHQLSTGYDGFVFHEKDFVNGGVDINHRTARANWFDERIRSYLSRNPHSILKKIVRTKPLVNNPEEATVDTYSSNMLSVLSETLFVSVTVGVLLIPVYLLFLVNMTLGMMAMITSVFVLLFCVVMRSTTDAKTQDVLIGTAAYAAFLGNFLSNVKNNQNQTSS